MVLMIKEHLVQVQAISNAQYETLTKQDRVQILVLIRSEGCLTEGVQVYAHFNRPDASLSTSANRYTCKPATQPLLISFPTPFTSL